MEKPHGCVWFVPRERIFALCAMILVRHWAWAAACRLCGESGPGYSPLTRALLRPVDSLFSQYPALYLGEKETLRCKNGAENAIPGMPDGSYRVYGPGNEFLMLGQCQSGVQRTVKSFFEVKEG